MYLFAVGTFVIVKDAVHHLVAIGVSIDQNADASPVKTLMQFEQIARQHSQHIHILIIGHL